MEAFTATLAHDPTLLRELRHSLAAWFDRAGASNADRDSMVLATHEAAAHSMEHSESDSTLDVRARRNGDDSFLVHVRNDGDWKAVNVDAHGATLTGLTELASDVSIRTSTTVRMRKDL